MEEWAYTNRVFKNGAKNKTNKTFENELVCLSSVSRFLVRHRCQKSCHPRRDICHTVGVPICVRYCTRAHVAMDYTFFFTLPTTASPRPKIITNHNQTGTRVHKLRKSGKMHRLLKASALRHLLSKKATYSPSYLTVTFPTFQYYTVFKRPRWSNG